MAQVALSYTSFAFPAWAAEQLTPEKLMPGGARLTAAAFPYLDQVQVTVGAAGAAIDAITVPIDALALSNRLSELGGVIIPAGSTIDFGGDKFATLTAAASIGDTSLTVRALVTALVDNDTGTFRGASARRPVTSGLLVGRTFAERAAGTGFGAPDVSTPDDELYLTAVEIVDAEINPDVTLLRHGTLIYEDKLPGWATLGAPTQAAIRARYDCITSAA